MMIRVSDPVSIEYPSPSFSPKNIIPNNPNIIDGIPHTSGAATLYPPFVFGESAIDILEKNKIYELTNQDDDYLYCLKKKFAFKKAIKKGDYKEIYLFHDEEKPLKEERKKNESFEKRLEKIKIN